MPTLYDVLGVASDASAAELRRAYRSSARALHPDLNPGADTTDAMRAINEAWAVLGDPARRRDYDRQLHTGPSPAPAEHVVRRVGDEAPLAVAAQPLSHLLRPSVLILAVLGIIFVVTAYAAPRGGGRTPAPTPAPTTPSDAAATQIPPSSAATAPAGAATPATGPATPSSTSGGPAAPQTPATPQPPVVPNGAATPSVVGQCITPLSGYDAVVPCDQAGAEAVVAGVARGSDCPAASTPYQLAGRSQLVCLIPAARR